MIIRVDSTSRVSELFEKEEVNLLHTGTVPACNLSYTGTVPVTNLLFTGTLEVECLCATNYSLVPLINDKDAST